MSDIKTRLLEIRELLNSGLITQGEHDELRQKILGAVAIEIDKKSVLVDNPVGQTIVPMAGSDNFDDEPMFLVPDLRDEDEGRWSSKTRPPVPNSEFPGLSYSEPASGREQGDLAEFADADDATSPFIRRVGDDFKVSESLNEDNIRDMSSMFGDSSTAIVSPVLHVSDGLCNVKELKLNESSITIGRGRKCDIMIMNDPKASRQHCRIFYEDNLYFIEDSNSIHGTWINRNKISSKTPLTNGDEIRVGETVFGFHHR